MNDRWRREMAPLSYLIHFVSICLLCLVGQEKCCDYGWSSYAGNCYKISTHDASYIGAGFNCLSLDAILASVSNEGKLLFLSNLAAYSEATDFWVGISFRTNNGTVMWFDETPITNQPWVHVPKASYPDMCAAYNGAKVVVTSCHSQLNFICERRNVAVPDHVPCPVQSLAAHRSNSCFWISSEALTLDNANLYCLQQEGSVAKLSDVFHESVDHFSDLVIHNLPFWLSTRWEDFNSTFFQLFSDTISLNGSGSCITITFSSQNPYKFFLLRVNCNETANVLCKGNTTADSIPITSHAVTTRGVTRTYFDDKSCPHGYNWKEASGGFCFWETSYETEKLSWNDAQLYCQSYGGNLASFHSIEEEEIGLSFQYGSLAHPYWIGLKYDIDNDSYVWVDGSPLDYMNWAPDQPSHQQFRMKCVQMDAFEKHWIVSYCGQLSWFVCKAPKQVNPQLPVLPTPEPMQTCGSVTSISVAYMLDNYCYETVGLRFGWHRAQLYCENDGGNLVSIHSEREVDFLIRLLYAHKGLPGNRIWIGLNSVGFDGILRWSDGSEVDFVNWNLDEPNNYLNQERCCNMYIGNALWNDGNCNSDMSFICKKRIGSATDRPKATSPPVTGNCKERWYSYYDYCYLPVGHKKVDWANWTNAAHYCENLNSNLVSIRNAKEQAFVTFLLQSFKSDAWIGFHDAINEGVYYWKDNSPLFFTNWAPGEPSFSGIEEDCVALSYIGTTSGVWHDTVCSKELPFICKANKDPSITEPWIPRSIKCIYPEGWLRQGMSCYMLFRIEETFQDANDTCAMHHARLVSVSDLSVEAVTKYLAAEINSSFWIGLTVKDEHKLLWSNGFPLILSRWNSNEPYLSRSGNTCFSSTPMGLWQKSDCNQKLPFLCQVTSGQAPAPVFHSGGSCPSGEWVDIGDENCYSFETVEFATWNFANLKCFAKGSQLVSIHSMQQLNKLKKHLKAYGDAFFIGLTRNEHGGFAWSDLTPVDFIHWDQGEPESINHHCVDMLPGSFKWRTVRCNLIKPYICSIAKENLNGSEHFPQVAGNKEASTSQVSGGAIAAVIVSLLVIIVVAVAAFMYFQPIQRSRLRSGPQVTSFENALFNTDSGIEIENKNVSTLYVHD